MKTRRLLLLVGFVATVFGVMTLLSGQTTQTCDSSNTPPQDPNGQSWAPNTAVTVNIDPLFVPDVNSAIQSAFQNWQNSPAGQASGVTFSFASSNTSVSGPGTYQISQQTPADGTSQAETGGGSNGNGRRVSAFTHVNPAMFGDTSITQQELDLAVTEMMAHEIGHTYDENDCTGCNAGASVMTPAAQGMDDTTSGRPAPSTCDSNAAIQYGNYATPTPTPSPTPPPKCTKTGTKLVIDGGCNPSPIIIDVDGSGFQLTDADHGVKFDIFNTGTPVQLGWSAAGSTNAFLVLDRNGNNKIDNGAELFGNFTPQSRTDHPNGFLALAEFDKPANGGNGDGVIDKKDAIFSKLRLWQDLNHDGISQPEELHTLEELGVQWISLDYQGSRRVDRFGNEFRFRARVDDAAHSRGDRWAWDVFFVWH